MRIGPYTVEERLGRGAFSVVFRARADDGRVLALKVLDESEHDRETLDRFLREARIAARLVDDSVPRIHEIGSDGTRHFIAMDLVEGQPLDVVVRERGKLGISAVAEIGVQLARALSVAHATGIVHRDIKPANVILRNGGKLKLLDFGLSQMVGMQSISAPGVLVGTVPYMSPEQLLGEGVDARSDVFSASAVLYELLTATRPFPGERFETVSHAILNVSPRRLAEHEVRVPEGVERVIFKGLMKRPEDRYQSAGDMLHDWELIAMDPHGSSSAPLIAQSSVLEREERSDYAAFVGRDDILGRVDRILSTISPDGGCVVAISGEGGAGKTRLLEAVAERAKERGLEVIDARCQGGRGTRAYQVWAELLDRYVERRGATTREAIHELFEKMGLGLRTRMLDLFLRIADPTTAEQPTSTRGLWEALLAFWRSAASSRPLTILIDDLHRADPLTLQFLGYVAANLRGNSLVVACAYRTDEVPTEAVRGDLEELLAEARRADRLVSVAAEPLTRDDVEALVSSRFGEFEGAGALVDRVVAESGGNPLYVIETLKLLEAEGRLVSGAGEWSLVGDLRDIPIPQKVVDLIRQRLSGVGDSDRELLDAAAVAGDTFPAKVLADCFETTQLRVLRRLRALEQVNGIVTSTEGGFRFAQSKIREYLLEGIPHELTVAYHRSIAETLIESAGHDEDRAAEIAEHLIEGGDPVAAVPYLERSGDRNFRFFANDAALDAYERAREIIEEHGADASFIDRSRLGRKTTAVELRLSRLEEAILTASVALRMARRAEDPRECGEALLVLSEAHANRGDEERALAATGEAREAFEAAGDEAGLARALDHEGNVLQRQGRLDEALELYREALSRRERLGLSVAAAHSHYRIGSVLKRLSRLDESLAELTRAREVLDEAGEAVTAASTSGEIGSVHFMQNAFEAAAAEYARCLNVMRAAGERRRLAIALMNAGSAELLLGNLSRSQSLYRECLAIRLDVQDDFGIGLVQTNLAAVFRYQARYREAILAAHDGVVLTRELKDLTYAAEAMTQTGWIAFELGDVPAARGWFERALAIYVEREQAIRVASRQVTLAEVAVADGEHERALSLIEAARQAAGNRWSELVREERMVHADIAAASGALDDAARLAAEAYAATAHVDFFSRSRVEAQWVAHGVRASAPFAREAGARIPGAIGAVQRGRLRGLELLLRIARAEFLARSDHEAALGEMRLAFAVAEPIISALPPGALTGWARRSGYHAALDRCASWAAEAGDDAAAGDVRQRHRAFVADQAERRKVTRDTEATRSES